MDPTWLAGLLILLALAVLVLILGERRDSRVIMWAAKPLASAIFVAIALLAGPPTSAAAWALLAAIILSFVGDLFLIDRAARIFRIGILAFLLAHVAFVAAFVALGVGWGWAALALVPLVANALVVARWILPKVDATLRASVIAYILVITTMVALACGATARGAPPMLLVAAIAFYANDILVARDRFVTRTWINRLIGLPLYYGAMALFALHVA